MDPGSVGKQGYYDSCYATVRYDRPNFEFLTDADLGPVNQPLPLAETELWRNCVSSSLPSVELLTAEGGTAQLQWAEGSGIDEPLNDDVVASMFSIRVCRVKFTYEWSRVPEQYLSVSSQFPFYSKLFSCNGKGNSKTFLGFPAGTLLCDAPHVDRFQYPTSTFDGKSFWGCNVRFQFTYFNPTLGVPDTNPADNNKARGWRTYPSSKNNKWYGIKDRSGPIHWPSGTLKRPISEGCWNILANKNYLFAAQFEKSVTRHVSSLTPKSYPGIPRAIPSFTRPRQIPEMVTGALFLSFATSNSWALSK